MRQGPRLVAALAPAAALVLAGCLVFTSAMTAAPDHDENMYVTAGVLLDDLSMYSDFAFLQMPYLPWLYRTAFALTGTTSTYLVARVVTVLFALVAAVALYLAGLRVTGSRLAALCGAALLLLNELVVRAVHEASNHVAPMALGLLAFLLFTAAFREGSTRRALLLLSGIAVGAAVGTRLTYAALLPVYAIASSMWPSHLARGARLKAVALPWLAGTVVGLLPAAWYLVRAPGAFVFDNLGYHLANAEWRRLTGFPHAMTLEGKATFLVTDVLAVPTVLVLVLGAAVALGLAIAMRADREAGPEPGGHRERVLAAMLLAASTLVALAPSPVFAKYFTVPIPYLILLVVYTTRPGSPHAPAAGTLLVAAAAISLGLGGPRYLATSRALGSPSRWVPVDVHAKAASIGAAVAAAGPGKVATLTPLLAVEAGLPVYPELASGPFLYRVGDLLTPEQRAGVRGTSPSTVGDLLRGDPPSAVLVGFEGELDAPLEAFARRSGYVKADGDFWGATLYVRTPPGPS